MKRSTLLYLIVFVLGILILAACEKKTTAPAPTTSSVTTPALDTSASGNYKMIYSSVTSEQDTTVKFTLVYSSHSYQSGDTVNPYIWFALKGFTTLAPGMRKVSKTVIYDDSNNSDAKVQKHNSNVTGGFYSDTKCKLNNGNKFSGDTLILNFHVTPASGPQFDMSNKYLKQ